MNSASAASPAGTTCRLMGTDEAGYGPNLGPLVVSVTSWQMPRSDEFEIYRALSDVIDRASTCRGTRLHIADSKQVYTPARGMGSLETTALTLLAQVSPLPDRYSQLVQQLTGQSLGNVANGEPWLREADLTLPCVAHRDEVIRWAERFNSACRREGVMVERLASDLIETPRFNRECQASGSKGVVLTRSTLSLLERHWPQDKIPTTAICDKHGGRNQYSAALSEAFQMMFVPKIQESAECSSYRIRGGEVRFQVRAEQYLPTAVASILSKYLRELSMEMFNRYWAARVSGLKATKGYPEDARRFRDAVASTQRALEISDDVFWRCK